MSTEHRVAEHGGAEHRSTENLSTENRSIFYRILASKVTLFASAVIVILASSVLALGIGSIDISYSEIIDILFARLTGDSPPHIVNDKVVVELRLPRLILAFLAGAGLSLAGAVLQTVTRNPLADPYLFGISSGASFGAVLVIAATSAGAMFDGLGLQSGLQSIGITAGAFLGSTLSVVLVISLSGMGAQIERMLLAGVAVSFMFGAATSLVLYMADAQAVASLIFWTLGSFTKAHWEALWMPVLVIVVCISIFFANQRRLQVMLAGDESAISLGVEVKRLRISMLLLSSLLTATLVANCGGIGFVGLMVPHIVRRLLEGRSKHLMVACVLFGGCFMVWVDVLARTVIENNELPIGVITAAIGSAFFLLVLRRRSWG
jgi:iron complex transport system permease protein